MDFKNDLRSVRVEWDEKDFGNVNILIVDHYWGGVLSTERYGRNLPTGKITRQ